MTALMILIFHGCTESARKHDHTHLRLKLCSHIAQMNIYRLLLTAAYAFSIQGLPAAVFKGRGGTCDKMDVPGDQTLVIKGVMVDKEEAIRTALKRDDLFEAKWNPKFVKDKDGPYKMCYANYKSKEACAKNARGTRRAFMCISSRTDSDANMPAVAEQAGRLH